MKKSLLTGNETKVDHKNTPDSIAKFALMDGHNILWTCWKLWQNNDSYNDVIRWHEAMQLAAIELSIQLKEAQELLLIYRLRYGEIKKDKIKKIIKEETKEETMANEFICSDCGEDGTRCDCHKKRKPKPHVDNLNNSMAKEYNNIHGANFHDDASLMRYLKNEEILRRNFKK